MKLNTRLPNLHNVSAGIMADSGTKLGNVRVQWTRIAHERHVLWNFQLNALKFCLPSISRSSEFFVIFGAWFVSLETVWRLRFKASLGNLCRDGAGGSLGSCDVSV